MYMSNESGRVIWEGSSKFTKEEEDMIKNDPRMFGIILAYGVNGYGTRLMQANKKLLEDIGALPKESTPQEP